MFRFVQLRKYCPNSRCRPPSCLLAVFAVFFAIISPVPASVLAAVLALETSEMSAIFFFHNQNNSTSSPGLLGNSALTCSGLHF